MLSPNNKVKKMKMNYLLIFIIALALSKSKRNDIEELLSSVSVEDGLALLKTLGIDDGTIQTAISVIPDLISGKGDKTSLIKKLLPLLARMSSTSTAKNEAQAVQETYEDSFPVQNFIPDEIKSGLQEYFDG